MNRKILSMISTLFLAVLMVGISEYTGEREIIFPEITALALGALVAPKMIWNTNRIRMIIWISICSVLGVLIVRYIPLSLSAKLVLAFFVSQIVLYASGTTFAPLTSALVLPVLIGTKSFIYPISAILLTVVIAILSALICKKENGILPKFYPETKSFDETFLSFSPFYKRLIVVSIMIVLMMKLGLKFAIAPPIIVAFIELSNPLHGMRKRPIFTCAFVCLSTLLGSLSRFLFTNVLSLPLFVGAFVALLILLIIVNKTEMYFPPAGAMCTLPFLVSNNALLSLPLHSCIGIIIFIAIAKIMFPDTKFKM